MDENGQEPHAPPQDRPPEIAGLLTRLGQVGVWAPQLQWQPAAREQDAAREVEALGFGAIWVGEATGKEILTHSALLLAATSTAVIATGIASIWARDPMAMANGARTLNEAHPGRFLLGLGVSHPFLTEPRERHYDRPLTAMRDYLDAMRDAPYAGPPAAPPPIVLAALGPKMLDLARDRAAGAHTYFVPVEHTEIARGILGPGPLLAPEQAAVFSADGGEARRIARRYTSTYLALPNYVNNLRRLGWEADDLAGDGSDRLLDALVAWGDADAVVARVRAHLDAGADHVAVRVVAEDPKALPMDAWKDLAAALT